MPLSEKEIQLIPQLEKLSVSIEHGGHKWKNQLSTTEKKKIFQIARIINHQRSKEVPGEKFKTNLEKSIENHMKRMATRTGKNIRIIKPPPAGLKVLRNGEWVLPKQPSFASVERAQQLLAHVPMTIPVIESSGRKIEKLKSNPKKRKSKHGVLSSNLKNGIFLSDAEKVLLFKKMFVNFMKKRKEFIETVKDLQDHLEDLRLENSAHLISSLSQTKYSPTTERKVRRRTKRFKQTSAAPSSCPALLRKTKPKIIFGRVSDHTPLMGKN